MDKPNQSKDGPMLIPTLPGMPTKFAHLLESYARIPKEAQLEHVVSLRNRAYKQHPYPCLGRFRFVDLDLSNHPLYNTDVLPLLKSPSSQDTQPVFLDFGTCLGQDIRQLLLDGVPATAIYGSDILPAFIDVGYELFKDENTFPRSHFLTPADAFDDSPSNPLTTLNGRVSILHISAVFHLFLLDRQRILARRCLRLLNRKAGKCLILGAQTANVNSGEYTRVTGKTRYRHNAESWHAMWEEAAREDGECRLTVEMILQDPFAASEGRGSSESVRAQMGHDKVTGLREDGFRWSTFWIWVDFEEAS